MAELLGQAKLLNCSCASVFLSVQWEFHHLTHRNKDYRSGYKVPALAQSLDGQTSGRIHTHSLGSRPQGWLGPDGKEKSASHRGPLLKAKGAAVSDLQLRGTARGGGGGQSHDGRSHPSGSPNWGRFMGASSHLRVHRPPPS